MEPVQLPRHIDQPRRLFLWTVTEVLIFSCPFGASLLLPSPLYMIGAAGIGLTAVYVYRRYRDRYPDGFAKHAVYWTGLLNLKGKSAINPHHRRIYPT